MRAILVAAVGAIVAMVALAGPVSAGGITDDAELREHRHQRSHEEARAAESATHDVIVEEYHSAGAEFGLGLASTVLSILYHPPRMILGVIGAHLGGIGGWATGGDLRTAKALWRPTVEGDYFVRTDHLDGAEDFDVVNTTPVFHGRYTVREVRTTVPEPAVPAYEDRTEYPDDLDTERTSDRDSYERRVEERAGELTQPSDDDVDADRR
jgi:hypothetical protein